MKTALANSPKVICLDQGNSTAPLIAVDLAFFFGPESGLPREWKLAVQKQLKAYDPDQHFLFFEFDKNNDCIAYLDPRDTFGEEEEAIEWLPIGVPPTGAMSISQSLAVPL